MSVSAAQNALERPPGLDTGAVRVTRPKIIQQPKSSRTDVPAEISPVVPLAVGSKRARGRAAAPSWQASGVLDALPQPVIFAEPSGGVSGLNACAERTFGYAQVEVVGQPIERLLPRVAARQPRRARCKDGTTINVAVSRQTFVVDGECLDIYLVRDLSDEEERLRRQEEFFASAAHELRAPAAILRASAEALMDVLKPDLGVDERRLLVNIERDAERLSTLIDDLLDLNSIRAGRVELHPTTCDLRDVAEQATRTMKPLAQRQGQTLTVVLPPEPVQAVVDAEVLGRALLNVVANACKYGRQNGGRMEVRLEADSAEAVFTVRDDGPGIPEADRDRIFQPFYRAPTADGRRVQGNGLGLPLCRAAVELHGGRVWVDRERGTGSVFRIALPLESGLPRPPELGCGDYYHRGFSSREPSACESS